MPDEKDKFMWLSAIAAYLHYLGFLLIFAALTVENFTLKKELTVDEAKKIVLADAVYGLSATVVFITGMLRVMYFGKGADYYLSNPVFYAKIILFSAIGAISLYPTVSFFSWVKNLRVGQPPTLELAKFSRISWLVKAELCGLVLLPLLAALMARGIGSA